MPMRALTLGLALIAATAAAAPAIAREASAEATAVAARSNGTVSLSWTGLSGPVDIWQLPKADAPRASGRKLLSGSVGNGAIIPVAAWPRPYFLLRDSKGREIRTAERVLPLDGGSNFRDLGGYRAADGAAELRSYRVPLPGPFEHRCSECDVKARSLSGHLERALDFQCRAWSCSVSA
jgi:hypothetical protein